MHGRIVIDVNRADGQNEIYTNIVCSDITDPEKPKSLRVDHVYEGLKALMKMVYDGAAKLESADERAFLADAIRSCDLVFRGAEQRFAEARAARARGMWRKEEPPRSQ